ncbi:MAG: hypothetical protein H6737_12225 [Alphaproteobacteria bacterium]|nr:hypothetical protein [Alphaproteobacteria bacterium]
MDPISSTPTHDGILVDLTPPEARNQAVPGVLIAALFGLMVWVPATVVMDVGAGGAQAVLAVLGGILVLAVVVLVRDALVQPTLQTIELGARRLVARTVNRLGEDTWTCSLDELTSVDLLGEVLLIRRREGPKYLQLHGQSVTNRLALRDLLRSCMSGAEPQVPEALRDLVRTPGR